MKLTQPESMWLFISEDLTGLLQMGQSTAIVGGYYIQKPKTIKQRGGCVVMWCWLKLVVEIILGGVEVTRPV